MSWRKAKYSGANGQCVEVADFPPVILVRDTTDRLGTVLELPLYAWTDFTRRLTVSGGSQSNADGLNALDVSRNTLTA